MFHLFDFHLMAFMSCFCAVTVFWLRGSEGDICGLVKQGPLDVPSIFHRWFVVAHVNNVTFQFLALPFEKLCSTRIKLPQKGDERNLLCSRCFGQLCDDIENIFFKNIFIWWNEGKHSRKSRWPSFVVWESRLINLFEDFRKKIVNVNEVDSISVIKSNKCLVICSKPSLVGME